MADVLQEFLVNVKYAVDSASQTNLLTGLKRVALSVGGIAAELGALSAGIFEMSRRLAQAGEQLNYMSGRLGSSVSDIQAASNAMERLGVSADAAKTAFEGLSQFSRQYGQAATGYLRSMGVTAKDTVTQMHQIAAWVRANVGAPGTNSFALARLKLQQAGIADPGDMLLTAMQSGQYQQQQQQQTGLLERIWGVKTEAELRAKTDRYAANAKTISNQFRDLGTIVTGLEQTFASEIFPRLQPELEHLKDFLLEHRDDITTGLSKLADIMIAIAHGSVMVVQGVGQLIDAFNSLDPASKHMLEVMAGVMAAVSTMGQAFLKSPMFWFMAGLVALLGLLDDYKAWQEHRPSHFDWGKFEGVKESIDGIGKSVFGVTNGFWDLLGVVGTVLGLAVKFGVLRRAVLSIGGAAARSGAGLVGMASAGMGAVALLAGAAAAAGAVVVANDRANESLDDKMAKLGYTKSKTSWWNRIPTYSKEGEKPLTYAEAQKLTGNPAFQGDTRRLDQKIGDPLNEEGAKRAAELEKLKASIDPNLFKDTDADLDKATDLGIPKRPEGYTDANAAQLVDRQLAGNFKVGGDMEVAGDLKITGSQVSADVAAIQQGMQGAGGAPSGGGWTSPSPNIGGGGPSAGGGAAAIGDGGGGGTTGDAQVDAVLKTIRTRESQGRYGIHSRSSSASGAYQFISSTWQTLTKKFGIGQQYQNASDAPPEVQDRVAGAYVGDILKRAHGDVSKVPLEWYTGNQQGIMSQHALEVNRGLTPQSYQSAWMRDYAKQSGGSGAPPMLSGGTQMASADLPATAPLGSKGAGGFGTSAFGGGAGDVTLHQTTTVNVAPGPDAASTAAHVANAQGRVNQNLQRGVVGYLR